MKKILTVAFAMAGAAVFADAANTLVYFSTKGPDTYADGATVLDGERYALVWSADGNFDGITISGEAVDTNDTVFCIMSRAKNGRCPMTAFQVDSLKAPTNGTYEVYLLDTRVADAEGSLSKLSAAKGSVPEVIRASSNAATATYAAKAQSFGGATQKTASETASAAVATAIAPGKGAAPEVTGIRMEGDNVVITVKNTSGFFTYGVVGGDDPSALDEVKATAKGGETADASVDIYVRKKDGGQFFKVKRN